MAIQGYDTLDATDLAALVRTRQVHPRELVEEVITRLESINPRLNALAHRLYEPARTSAGGPLPEGPFQGVPFLVKDLDGYLADAPYSAGSRALEGFIPGHDSEQMARFRRAGVVIVAKTTTPEFGILGVTETALKGPTRNPWNPSHTPGGSSGGSAVCVAARVVPMAHAGDGGGSIRIPASACGLFGLKPTRGRNPVGPDALESWGGFVQRHVLTRSVRDSAAMLDATHGSEAGAPYQLSRTGRQFIAGLLRHGREITAVTNQWVNSYKRLAHGFEAPAAAISTVADHGRSRTNAATAATVSVIATAQARPMTTSATASARPGPDG